MSTRREDFTIGWICALAAELTAARAMLDEEYECDKCDQCLPVAKQDSNVYTLGRIGQHNVVITSLPVGIYGTCAATSVATNMLQSFSNIRVGLMVGIGGGLPMKEHDIRLGDVVVSSPIGCSGGCFSYDCGRSLPCDRPAYTAANDLERTPSRPLNNTQGVYQFDYYRKELGGIEKELNKGCVQSPFRKELEPVVHYGMIGSAGSVLKSATRRDNSEVLCFEMEAAGLMGDIECLVIRGICDYVDSHKSRSCATAVAAGFAKDLLLNFPEGGDKTPTRKETSENLASALQTLVRRRRPHTTDNDTQYSNKLEAQVRKDTITGVGIDQARSQLWSDLLKLGAAYVVSTTTYLLSTATGCDREQIPLAALCYCNYVFGTQIVLILIYWIAQCSLIWNSPAKENRLRFAFWTHVIIFFGGALLHYDLTTLTVLVLPLALNLSMSMCLVIS